MPSGWNNHEPTCGHSLLWASHQRKRMGIYTSTGTVRFVWQSIMITISCTCVLVSFLCSSINRLERPWLRSPTSSLPLWRPTTSSPTHLHSDTHRASPTWAHLKVWYAKVYACSLSTYTIPRVNNKEREKRVSNTLYAPYKMSAENHASGIQKLTNESAHFKWYVVSVASSAS